MPEYKYSVKAPERQPVRLKRYDIAFQTHHNISATSLEEARQMLARIDMGYFMELYSLDNPDYAVPDEAFLMTTSEDEAEVIDEPEEDEIEEYHQFRALAGLDDPALAPAEEGEA